MNQKSFKRPGWQRGGQQNLCPKHEMMGENYPEKDYLRMIWNSRCEAAVPRVCPFSDCLPPQRGSDGLSKWEHRKSRAGGRPAHFPPLPDGRRSPGSRGQEDYSFDPCLPRLSPGPPPSPLLSEDLRDSEESSHLL